MGARFRHRKKSLTLINFFSTTTAEWDILMKLEVKTDDRL